MGQAITQLQSLSARSIVDMEALSCRTKRLRQTQEAERLF